MFWYLQARAPPMLSEVSDVFILASAGVNFGGARGRETAFWKLNFVAGGSPKKYTNAKLKKNEQTNDERDKNDDKSNNRAGKTVPSEESSDDRKHNCHHDNYNEIPHWSMSRNNHCISM